MKLSIYQVMLSDNPNTPAFRPLSSIETVDPTFYHKVWEGYVDATDLEDAFRIFNVDHPADYTCRSMSVSDVLEVSETKGVADGFYFCDDIGFKKIDFDKSLIKF